MSHQIIKLLNFSLHLFVTKNSIFQVVDLPTIIESQKTIDRKTFYKTADISQMVVCQEGEPSDEEDAPVKPKKYDPNKVTTFA